VTDNKVEKWREVHPIMMSDKETIDSKTLKQRWPEWRSDEFNNLVDLLDNRNVKHPRKEQIRNTNKIFSKGMDGGSRVTNILTNVVQWSCLNCLFVFIALLLVLVIISCHNHSLYIPALKKFF